MSRCVGLSDSKLGTGNGGFRGLLMRNKHGYYFLLGPVIFQSLTFVPLWIRQSCCRRRGFSNFRLPLVCRGHCCPRERFCTKRLDLSTDPLAAFMYLAPPVSLKR